VDDIMIIDEGHIREFGRRRDLVSNPHSHFAELLATGMQEAFA
jgi:ABC-type multidrug transport system fused ATPase/permease subunit